MTSPLRRRRRGAGSLASRVSAERTAKPSTIARSKGGTFDGRCHILREHAAERRRKWNGLRSKRRKLDLTGETGERVIGGSDSEKLLLPRCAADSCEGIIGRRRKRLTHGQGLTITSLCGG